MFQNRYQAGRILVDKLKQYQNTGALVLVLPRGGVPVGYEIAKKLGFDLDVIVVRKLGAPGNPELAIGAIGPNNTSFIDENLCQRLGVSREYLDQEIARQQRELERREKIFRCGREKLKLTGKTIILVDDGIATGATTKASVQCLRKMGIAKIVLAVPVASQESVKELKGLVNELIVLEVPALFFAVGQFYREFEQVSDEEVIKLLNKSFKSKF